MKNLLILLALFIASCGTQEMSFAPETQHVNNRTFTYRPGDEMYEALIPYKLFFDKEFQRPDSIMVRGEKKMYYYKGKYILTLCK
jgi:hypothetical protein